MRKTMIALAMTGMMPALAADVRVAALASVQPGSWTLNSIDGSGGRLTMCVSTPRQFVQLRHPGQRCASRVLVNEGKRATIEYRCRGTGYGRTTLNVEGPRLVTIDTQGLADGAPFDVSYEARHQGACQPR